MFNEAKIPRKQFDTIEDLLTAVNSKRNQFGEIEQFPTRLSLKRDSDTLETNSSGRFVLVNVGEKKFVIPHPVIVIDDVTYEDTGLKNIYNAQGFIPNQGQRFDRYTITELAELDGEFKVIKKGTLQVQ